MNIQNSLSKSSTVMVTQGQLSSDMGKETIILDSKSGIYFGLNSVGASIWNLIIEPKKVTDIRDAIAEKYQIDSDRCENDILNLLQELADEGLIEVQNEAIAQVSQSNP